MKRQRMMVCCSSRPVCVLTREMELIEPIASTYRIRLMVFGSWYWFWNMMGRGKYWFHLSLGYYFVTDSYAILFLVSQFRSWRVRASFVSRRSEIVLFKHVSRSGRDELGMARWARYGTMVDHIQEHFPSKRQDFLDIFLNMRSTWKRMSPMDAKQHLHNS